jgi:hypothetical protein
MEINLHIDSINKFIREFIIKYDSIIQISH